MKQKIISIIFLFSLVHSYSQNENYSLKYPKNSKEMNIRCYEAIETNGTPIKGKSQIINEEDTLDSDLAFDIHGNKTLEITIPSPGLIIRYVYDSKNNLIEKSTTNPNNDYIHTDVFILKDSLPVKKTFYKGVSKRKVTETIFEYDKFGNNISKSNFNKKGNKLWQITNSFDENNNKIKTTHYNKDRSIYESISYAYDTKGNIIKFIKSRPAANMNIKHLSQYDDHNNQIKLQEFGSDGNLTYINTYYYNKKNKLVKREEYDSEMKLIRLVKIKYDKLDTIIKENVHYTSTNSSVTTSFDYVYDDNGNWISKIKYLNNKPRYIIERNITYYK